MGQFSLIEINLQLDGNISNIIFLVMGNYILLHVLTFRHNGHSASSWMVNHRVICGLFCQGLDQGIGLNVCAGPNTVGKVSDRVVDQIALKPWTEFCGRSVGVCLGYI